MRDESNLMRDNFASIILKIPINRDIYAKTWDMRVSFERK